MAREGEDHGGDSLRGGHIRSPRVLSRCLCSCAAFGEPTDFGVVALHQIRRARSVEERTGVRRNWSYERNIPMKNTLVPQTPPASTPAETPTVGRFQVYRQTRAGIYVLGFETDSDAEAVEAFMLQAPAFDGGEIRLLDRDEQRMIAFVKWKMETTEIGLPVFHRENVFHDWHLALIACEVQKQSQMRAAVELST